MLGVRAHERLDLRELGAGDVQRACDVPKQLSLLRSDRTGAYRRLQLKLHECARELAAIADLPFERAEAFGRRIALALPAIEMLDRALDFLWR